MTIPFAGTISADSVSFTGPDGKNHVISVTHPNNAKIRDTVKEIQAALQQGYSLPGQKQHISRLHEELARLADIPRFVIETSQGKVSVKGNSLFYDGEELHSSLSARIIWGLSEGYDMKNYVLFLENLMENPSKRAVDELFDFLEACRMGITDDGHFLAYKRVRSDLTDCYSGKFDNSPGQKHTMPRNKVDENKHETCSTGFHFCSFTYIPEFGILRRDNGTDRVVIVKINPKNVVAIPSDYKNAKGRTCEFEVVGEYQGPDLKDILAAKPIWNKFDVRSEFGHDEYESYADEGEDCCPSHPRDDQGMVSIDARSFFNDDTDHQVDFDFGTAAYQVIIDDYDDVTVLANDEEIDSDSENTDDDDIRIEFSNGGFDFVVMVDDDGGAEVFVSTIKAAVDAKYPETNPDGSRNGWVGNDWVPVTPPTKTTSPVVEPPKPESFITTLGYDTEFNRLDVGIHGKVYRYQGVPLAVYTEFAQSEHPGTFFNTRIKDVYVFEKE